MEPKKVKQIGIMYQIGAGPFPVMCLPLLRQDGDQPSVCTFMPSNQEYAHDGHVINADWIAGSTGIWL